MHIEFLAEDKSGEIALNWLVENIIDTTKHSWNIHAFSGVGRLPTNIHQAVSPRDRTLLHNLPRILRGYSNTPGIGAVVVVLDLDRRDIEAFRQQLEALAEECCRAKPVLICLSVEEIEAWYLGDRPAVLAAYPRAKAKALKGYRQDSICGTWEVLADAVYKGGAKALRAAGYPTIGQAKCEWADRIASHMRVNENQSPSFQAWRDRGRELIAGAAP